MRNAVIGFFAAALLILVASAAAGFAPLGPMIGCAVILALLVFERRRYVDQVASGPREPLTPTPERFIDPETGRQVQVWMNARGERHYVEQPQPGD